MATLLLRLEGPMQSWGTQSRFSHRDTGLEPSKSGVVGLLCAALGKPREERPGDEARWPTLASLAALRFGVRVDRPGRVARDFQTAGGARPGERYGVPKAGGGRPDTVTSQRYYLADASFLAGLEGDAGLLARLQQALARPVWPLYLGRKAYLPSRGPYLPDGLRDEPLEEALRTYPWSARTPGEAERARQRTRDAGDGPPRLRLVLDAPDPLEGDLRMDVPLSFAERRFASRRVVTDWVVLTEDLIEEDPLWSVTSRGST